MNHNLSNILYTKYKSRINDKFNYNYFLNHESRSDTLISKYNKDSLIQPLFLQNFCLDIVTESVFDYPQPYITEKVLRPISTKRMFIYVGPAYSLKFLKEFGFMTFSSYINEEYDNETDPKKRMMLIEKEIESFVNKPLEELKQILSNLLPVLENNFDILSGMYKSELDRIKNQLKDHDV
jgi:hypothetical protein